MSGLGEQTVTLTVSSLVHDMLEIYRERATEPFSCPPELLETFVEAFVLSMDCFFYTDGRAPYAQAVFGNCEMVGGELEAHVRSLSPTGRRWR